MSNLGIRLAYALLLGVVVAMTVGFGVAMLETGPHAPDTPSITFRQLQSEGDDQQQADRIIGVVDRFYQDAYDYRRAYPEYQRNVLLTMVLFAIVVGAAGLALGPAFDSLRLGLTIGAILLLLIGANVALSTTPNPAPTSSPSITNLLAAGSPPGLDTAGRFLRFAVSFVALLAFLFLGLWRLTDWAPAAGKGMLAPSNAGPTENGQREGERSAGASAAPPEAVVWRRPDSD